MKFKIGNKSIGGDSPCFITFEAGPTHFGVTSAKNLIKHASEAGADAIKFQILDPDRLVADRSVQFSYDILIDRDTGKTETITESLYEILARRSLSHSDWREIKKYCDECRLEFFSTIGFEDEISLLEEIGCTSIKIASSDINHLPLIKKAAETGICIQIDTGSATLDEVEIAVETIRSTGNEKIIIHQCPTGYPAHMDSIHLNMIPTLKNRFPFVIAFSDHTPGWDMDIAALSLGAELLEKTITENRETRSVEHMFSLEPHDMKKFVDTVRDVERAMGMAERELSDKELSSRRKTRRSIYLNKDVKAGDSLTQTLVDYRRPGYGIGPEKIYELEGQKFKHDLTKDHLLEYSDIE